MTSAAKRIAQLREQINFHDRKYYVDSRPAISDREYDRLMQELIELEKEHPELVTPESPTQRVGGDVQTELKPVRHAVPMMSIDNTYSEGEIRKFDRRVRDGLGGEQPAYVMEPKIDGTSISLRYENGRLVLGATRGRGNVGDDVTVNARTIKAIPLTLHEGDASSPPPPILEIRGEVYMDNEDFQRLNKEIEAEGEAPYANARNFTSGTLRRLDSKIVATRRLRFLAHGVGQVEPMPATSYWELTQLLRQWNLPVPEYVWRVENIDEAIARLHDFEKIRPKLPYMTDGMVVKVDSFEQRDRLGATSKSPRWVVAYKYETEQQPTILKNVRWQVGKGGSLTPVADVEPVFIGGVTVTHVTLHNFDQIQKLDIHIGDTVAVERAGEVIPHVVAVVKEKRSKGAKSVSPPSRCPECGEKTEWEDCPEGIVAYRCLNAACKKHFERKQTKKAKVPELCKVCQGQIELLDKGIELYCVNPDCPAQLKERLFWFCQRGQMDIKGLGEALIDQLVEKRVLASYADIFRMRSESIAGLMHESQVGMKKATGIVECIRKSQYKWPELKDEADERWKKGDLQSAIGWLADRKRLNIENFGPKTIEQAVRSKLIQSPEDLYVLTDEQIASLPQLVKVGELNARKIVESTKRAKARGLARVLAGLGIRRIGATASRAFAEWAGSIDKLTSASVNELAAVLMKGKDRQFAEALFRAVHKVHQRDLFNSEDLEQSTEDFLKKRNNDLSEEDRIDIRGIRAISEFLPMTNELREAQVEDLLQCLVQGKVVAQSLHDYLCSQQGKRIIESLRNEEVKLTEDKATKTDSEWSGKTVVITGSFEGYTREKIKEQLILFGAKVSDSVSSKTDVVFVGTEPGSKHDKALALGIKILGEDAVHQLMES